MTAAPLCLWYHCVQVFGGVLSYCLKRSERYFGDGETFLFSYQGEECKVLDVAWSCVMLCDVG